MRRCLAGKCRRCKIERCDVIDRNSCDGPLSSEYSLCYPESDVVPEDDSVAKSPVGGDVEGDVDEDGDFDRDDLLLWIEFYRMEE